MDNTDKNFIRNCSWGYSCDAVWENLSKTDNEGVKFCDNCQREVHNSTSHEELAKNISLNRCVRFTSDLISTSNNRELQLTGYVAAPAGNFDDFDDDIPF